MSQEELKAEKPKKKERNSKDNFVGNIDYNRCFGYNQAIDDYEAYLSRHQEFVGIDEEKLVDILMSVCDTDSDEALMYSKEQAREITQTFGTPKDLILEEITRIIDKSTLAFMVYKYISQKEDKQNSRYLTDSHIKQVSEAILLKVQGGRDGNRNR